MREIREINPIINDIILRAANRTVVLLEGEDDLFYFEKYWYSKNLDQYYFHECGGKEELKKTYNDLEAISRKKNFFGIRDRDYDFTDEEINQINSSQKDRIFVLTKNTLENYFIQEEIIFNYYTTYFGNTKIKTLEDISRDIINLYIQLRPATAAVMTILEINKQINIQDQSLKKVECFSECHDINNSDKEVAYQKLENEVRSILKNDFEYLETIYLEKINLLLLLENNRSGLDLFTQGKRLICTLKSNYNINEKLDRFARNIAERMPVPVDIQNIFMHFSKINA